MKYIFYLLYILYNTTRGSWEYSSMPMQSELLNLFYFRFSKDVKVYPSSELDIDITIMASG